MSRDLRRMYRTAVSSQDLPQKMSLVFDGRELVFERMSWRVGDEDLGLRYGTNPHQPAAIYRAQGLDVKALGDMKLRKSGKGGLSATNIEDGYRALRIVGRFPESAASVMKHLNPSGVGIASDPGECQGDVFEKAWSGDPRASYGCVAGFNKPLDESVAHSIIRDRKYVECIFAPGCTDGVVDLLSERRDLRIIEVSDPSTALERLLPFEIRVLGDTILLEQPFYTKFASVDDLENSMVATKRLPTGAELRDLLHAWWVCCEKRSNGVTLWKKDRALGVGTGQQDRIGAIEVAVARATRSGHDLQGSVLASDGYMLSDNIKPLSDVGVTAVIQPGGSVSDKEVIEACNEHGISMLFTGERVFRHF